MAILDPSLVFLETGLESPSVTEEAIVQNAAALAAGAVKNFLKYDPEQKVRTEYYPLEAPRGGSREAIWEANSTEAYQRYETEASTNELQLKHLPIRKTDSDSNNAIDLRIDYDGRNGAKAGSFASDTQKTEGVDFWPNYEGRDSNSIEFCSDGILKSVGLWPLEPGSVRVTYVAGYTQAELNGQDANLDASPILEAVLQEAVRKVTRALSVNAKSGAAGFLTGPLMMERLGDYAYQVDSVASRRLFGGAFDLMPETKERLSSFVNYGIFL